jgi:hypothetical protein
MHPLGASVYPEIAAIDRLQTTRCIEIYVLYKLSKKTVYRLSAACLNTSCL